MVSRSNKLHEKVRPAFSNNSFGPSYEICRHNCCPRLHVSGNNNQTSTNYHSGQIKNCTSTSFLYLSIPTIISLSALALCTCVCFWLTTKNLFNNTHYIRRTFIIIILLLLLLFFTHTGFPEALTEAV